MVEADLACKGGVLCLSIDTLRLGGLKSLYCLMVKRFSSPSIPPLELKCSSGDPAVILYKVGAWKEVEFSSNPCEFENIPPSSNGLYSFCTFLGLATVF